MYVTLLVWLYMRKHNISGFYTNGASAIGLCMAGGLEWTLYMSIIGHFIGLW